MTRAKEIDELVRSGESHYPDDWLNDLREWVLRREDAELVEIVRMSVGALAVRSEGEQTFPSQEVFGASIKHLFNAFIESVEETL